jgi:TatD DNase family protein
MNDLEQLLAHIQPIDSHFHYFQGQDQGQPTADQLAFAFAHGMQAALEAGTPNHPFAQRQALAEQYPHLYLLAGHHPDAASATLPSATELLQQASYHKTIAVGEIGLDYSYDHILPRHQQQLFDFQLDIAKQVKKPVVLHVRDAHDDALAMIKASGITSGVVHCFTGNKHIAKSWLDAGFLLSFSGVVTFKNAKNVHESAQYCPLDRMLCETDAPFLAPTPYRGQPNQLSYVAYVYQYIAQLRGIDLPVLSSRICSNFAQIFAVSLV